MWVDRNFRSGVGVSTLEVSMKLKIAMLALVGFAAWGADITGKYTGKQPGRQGATMDVTFDLKADGGALTGNVSTQRGDTAITDGKVDGDKVSFKVKREFNGNAFVTSYTGKVEGDELKLTMTVEGRDGPAREVTAKRAK